MEPPVHCPESSTSLKICSSTELKQDTAKEQIDGSKLESTDDAEQLQKIGSSLDVDNASGQSEDRGLNTIADTADAMDCAIAPGLQGHTGVRNKDPCRKTSSVDDVSAIESVGMSGISDSRAANDYRSTVAFRNKEGSNYSTDESGTVLSRIEGVGEIERVAEHITDKSEDHPATVSESELRTTDPDVVQKNSNADLDPDVDPLEVARLVAIEVEREVDCREQSCSSSDKIAGLKTRQPDSPDSTCGPQSHVRQDSPRDVPTAADLSAETSPLREEEPAISAGSLDTEPINGAQEMECSQVTDGAPELTAYPEKDVCNFDLNQEVCSEDVVRPENPISTPISVVSASRAAAATGLPVAPLQFEGALGWKGSAATSAFRPASPRRISEADKAYSTGGSNSSSKQRDGCLDIDLNVDESVDEKTTYPSLGKQIPVSSGLPSGESSVEASPRRSERIEFDLNRVSDDGDAPSDWPTQGLVLHQRNGYLSQSPSSSSSSKQPSLRNIDLNDQPSFINESSDHPFLSKLSQSFNAPGVRNQPSFINESSDHQFLSKLSQSFNAPGVTRSDDTVISIMGMKVEVNRKDSIPQSLPLLNGRILEPTVEINMAKTGGFLGMGSAVPYTHSPVYGYNGLASGPAMNFPSGMYGAGGPVPYMLDSRGAPVIPQVLGSASTVPSVYSHPSFMMSMSGAPLSNGAGPSRSSFDLNSGLILEGGNRDTGGLRQLFNTGQASLMDEYLKSNSQASASSGAGVKRREPDSGWEPHPYKQHHPPTWK